MRSIDGNNGSLAAAGNAPQFAIMGGYYELSAVSGSWGSGGTLSVEHLLPDGATWFADGTVKLTANGVAQGYLSAGSYRINLSGTPTDPVVFALSRIPTGE